MNEAVTQTIHYLKPDGSYAIQDRITTLEFTRTATVNAETGEVIAWGAWTPTTTDTFAELVSPTFPDLFTDTKVIEATTVKAEDGDIEETVQYDPLFVTVPPDGPYIGETSKELLNTETTLTIHYVDKDGNQVAVDHTAVLAFTRTAKVNVETEKVESYSAWQPVTTDSFDAVDSPVLPDLFTVDKTVGPTKVTDPEKPIEETVVYNDLYLVVEPDGPYVGGTSQELQNQTVTQTIHYVKADGSEAAPDHVITLAFTRTAIINVETDRVDHFGEWQAVTTDTFDEVISPDVADQFTTKKKIDAVQVQAEDIDPEETVHYNDLYVVVQPVGPDYPGDTSKEDLNESVTQTIHYVDENGVTVSPDVSKTLTFTRTATINAETGAIVSHTDWTPVTTDTFEAVTSPSIDDLYTTQKTIDAVTVQADAVDINEDVVYHPLIVTVGPDGPFVGNTSKELLNQEVVQTIHYVDETGKPVAEDSVKTLAFTRTVKVNAETGEIVDEGTWIPTTTDTFDVVDSPTVEKMFADKKQIDAVTVTALQDDITETVTYKDLFVTVKPDGPYIGDATKEALNQQVNQTIHYVDSKGDTVFEDHTATLDFTRTVIVNAETGKITDEGTWTPTTTDTFGEVISPTSTSLFTADKKIDAVQVKAEDPDLEKTVIYNDLYITLQPEGPDYPGDSTYEQLNESVTQTIHYVKEDESEAAPDSVKTLTFTRTAKFNVETQKVESYSDWVAVDGDTFDEVKSPELTDLYTTQKTIDAVTVKADAIDIVEDVVYHQLIVTVGPDGPYVGNTSKELLNQEVVRTIHYVDETGKPVAEDSVKSLAFTRTVKVNAETGEIVDEGTWSPTTTDTFDVVDSPPVEKMFADKKQIDAVTVTALQDDITEIVTYKDLFVTVKPDGPYIGDATEELLNQSVTQTIHYVDQAGNTLKPDAIQTLKFTRTATVNAETGEVVDPGTWEPVSTDTFDEVVSPTVDDMYTTDKKIEATQVTADHVDIDQKVEYKPLFVVVQPDGPDYPGDTSKEDLNESVTQTIHYVDENGATVSPDGTKTLAFTRTATINDETGEIVSHTDWQPVTTDTFDAVTSPTFDDMFTKQKTIDAVTVKADAVDITETVVYNPLIVTVGPDGPFVGNTSKELLNQEVVQIIHYIDEAGNTVVDDSVKSLAFTRTVKVNAETGEIVDEGTWIPTTTDTFDAVDSPTFDNLFTTQKTINAVQVTALQDDITEKVIYKDLFVTVKPDGPYLGEATKEALNQQVSQTIHYVGAEGDTVHEDYTDTLAFTRTVVINVETGAITDQGTWTPTTTDTFGEVVSPTLPNLYTTDKRVDAVQVKAEDQDFEKTITYNDLYITIQPEGPDYPGDSAYDQLNHTVTQTIHYVKVDGSEAAPDSVKTLTFTRTAKFNVETQKVESYSDWVAVGGDTFAEVKSPDVKDQFTETKSIAETKVTAETIDIEETVHYNDLYQVVQPEGPDYPGETTKDLLNKTITATIHYLKADGSEAAKDDVQTLAFKRTATINVETGAIESLGDWQVVDGDTFKDVESPILTDEFTTDKIVKGQQITADSKNPETTVQYQTKFVIVQPEGPDYPGDSSQDVLNKTITQTIHYVDGEGNEVAEDNVATLEFTRTAKVDLESGEVVDWGDWQPKTTDTFVEVVSPTVKDLTPDKKQIVAAKVTGGSENITETVTYSSLYATVEPDGPFIGETSEDKLNHTVTQTIHYVLPDGSEAAPDSVKTLAFKRTAQVNVETGEILSYGDWQAVTIDTFDAVVSPTLADLFTTTKLVDATTVNGDTKDIVETVKYQDLYVIVKPGDDYQNDPALGDTLADQLITDTIRTIKYVDEAGNEVTQEYSTRLTFQRTAKVNVETDTVEEYTPWDPLNDVFPEVTSPDVENMFTEQKTLPAIPIEPGAKDIPEIVVYKDLYITVNPEDPTYPDGVTKDDLNQSVTQTIHYVKADGTEAAADHVATLDFTRTAKYNVETEKVESYSDWTAVNGDTFAEVLSPEVTDQFTTTKQIDAVTVDGDSKDIVETVKYQDLYVDVMPDGPYVGDATKDYLNQSVTNLIHYVDADGKTVSEDFTETLAFTRTATINVETGKVVDTSDWKPVTTDTFDDVTSPIVDNLFTKDKQIKGAQVKAEDADLETTVTYNDLYLVVQPDGPDYPAGTSKEDLNQSVTQTIHYVNENGDTVSPDVTMTLNFTRTATINVETVAVVSHTDWQATMTDTFEKVVSPEIADLFTTQKAIDAVTVKADAEDITEKVVYKQLIVTVQPDGPYVGDTNKELLNQSVTRTIHYVDADGNTVAPDVTETLDFTRTATVNVETGEIISKSDWQPVTTDLFYAVTSPVIEGLFTIRYETGAVTVKAEQADFVENVVYEKLYVTVNPDGPFVGDATKDYLNQSVTNTIHYVDADGKTISEDFTETLAFTRTATVNVETGKIVDTTDWQPVTTDTFDDVTSPTIDNLYTTDKLIKGTQVKAEDADLEATVTYKNLYVTLNPDDSDYPDGVTKDDLNQSVTQMIHYVKADGSEAAPDYVKSLTFTRTAKYNLETGKVEAYSDWTAVDGDTFAEVISPDVKDQFTDKKKIDAVKVNAETADIELSVDYKDLHQVVQPDGPDYPGDTTKELLNETVKSIIHYLKPDGSEAAPDSVQTLAFKRTATINVETGKIVGYGDWTPVTTDTFDDVDSPILTNEFTTDKTIKGQQVTADTADIETSVQYQSKFTIVQPEGPDYPGESSQDVLNKTVTQTIHYVDVNGDTVAQDNVATLDFTRTAKVDLETGKIVEFGAWQPKTTDTFGEVVSPTVEKLTPDHKQIDPVKVSITAPQDVETTVTYSDLYVTVQPEGPDYIGEASADKLNHTVTQTIHYVKADGSAAAPDSIQTVVFKRSAQVNVETGEILSYGDWEPVTTDSFDAVKSPDVPDQFTTTKQIDAVKVNGDSKDIVETVKYQDLYTTVNPDGPYTGAATKDYLNQSVTNTIHYVDADGKTVAEDASQTLDFTRTAKVNVETGAIVETGNWQPVTTDIFDDVPSPTIENLFTTDKQIKGAQVKADDADLATTVTYKDLYVIVQPEGPDYAGESSQEKLNETVTQTIHYVKADGSQVAEDSVQTLDFTRTAKVNVESGKVESYSDWEPVTTDTFAEVESPSVDGQFTTDKIFGAETVDGYQVNIDHTIKYDDLIVTVNPDGPYVGNATKDVLNKVIAQVIHYVDVDGKPIAPDFNATLTFKRTVTVNAETGEILEYGDWTPASDTFAAVPNPILKGYATDAKEVGSQTVTADSADLLTTVIYKAIATPTPKPEPQPKPQPEPEPQPAPDQGAQLGNETPAPNTTTQQIGPAVITPASAGTTNDQMPTTSDAQNTKLSLIGLILASFATVGAWFTSRKHKKGARH